METITISKKKFEGIIRQAFRKGERWGVAYSTWFYPTKEATKKEQDEAIKRGYEIVLDTEAKINELPMSGLP